MGTWSIWHQWSMRDFCCLLEKRNLPFVLDFNYKDVLSAAILLWKEHSHWGVKQLRGSRIEGWRSTAGSWWHCPLLLLMSCLKSALPTDFSAVWAHIFSFYLSHSGLDFNFKDYLFIYSSRKGKGGRKIKLIGCLCVPPTWDQVRNPGMCPDLESNSKLLVSRMMPNLLSHTSQGQDCVFLLL